jgi:hypothetical protein
MEAADRLDPGLDLCWAPVLAAEDPEVDPAAAHVREHDRVVRRRKAVERIEAFACGGTARVLSRVFGA